MQIHFDLSVALAILVTALAFFVFMGIDKIHRKREIEKLTNEIDDILHDCEKYSLSDYGEGEFCILRNEISKMTRMLKSQAEMLTADKVHLADSLADISHQIRTPLTSLNIMLATIKNPNTDHEKRLQTLYEMGRQLERIDRLVVSLLKMAKMDAGTIKLAKNPIELSKLIDNCVQAVEIMLEIKEIKPEVDVDGSFEGDIAWTEEAVTNILKNCIEHTNNGGRIRITGEENAVFSSIIIEDTGSGISKEDLPHIFERFYKGADSSNNSFGIGLALAKSIITGQNGTIKAENIISYAEDGSEIIKGTRFSIRFYKGVI